MDKERIYQDQDEYIEESLKANGYTMQEIEEMDIDEKRMNIGWD